MTWQSPLIQVNCARCGSNEETIIAETRDFEIPECKSIFRLSRCTQCGHIYSSIRPEASFLFSKHYPDDYICYGTTKGKFSAFLDGLRIKKQAESRACIVHKIFKNSHKLKVLEIGCATGAFLRFGKKQFGWKVCGVEPNAALCNHNKDDGCNIVCSTFEDVELPEGSFDAVCLFNVFEHLWDPVTSIKKINRLLRPGGMIIVEIPNMDATARKLFGIHWFLYHLPRHLTQFTLSSLDSFMMDDGLFSKVAIKKLFRPTVNALSLKYKMGDLFSSPLLSRFFSEANPLILGLAVAIEALIALPGNTNHIMAIYKKERQATNTTSMLRIIQQIPTSDITGSGNHFNLFRSFRSKTSGEKSAFLPALAGLRRRVGLSSADYLSHKKLCSK